LIGRGKLLKSFLGERKLDIVVQCGIGKPGLVRIDLNVRVETVFKCFAKRIANIIVPMKIE
jgi:hypothetical protein